MTPSGEKPIPNGWFDATLLGGFAAKSALTFAQTGSSQVPEAPMQGSTGSLGHPGSCKVLHAATRVRIVGGPAQIRGAGHCPLEIGRNTKGRRRHRKILSSFFMKIDAAQSTGRESSLFTQPWSSWQHAGVPWPLRDPAQGDFCRGCDCESFLINPSRRDHGTEQCTLLGLPRPPLLCRRWLRYPWIDCVDKMGRFSFRNTAWPWSLSSHDWLRYLQQPPCPICMF